MLLQSYLSKLRRSTKNVDGVYLAIYALIPNKKRNIYVALFRKVMRLKENIMARLVVFDFEQVATLTIKECFNSKGCFLHLSKNLKNHICEIDLGARFTNDKKRKLL